MEKIFIKKLEFKMKKVMFSIIFLFSLTFSMQVFSAEPPCPSTDPCIPANGWGEYTMTFTLDNCPACTISVNYLKFFSDGCPDGQGGTRVVAACYLKNIEFSASCITVCNLGGDELFQIALHKFNTDVLAPLIQYIQNPDDVLEFRATSCYSIANNVFTPCDNLYCCEYQYDAISGWTSVPTSYICPEYNDDNIYDNKCFATCGWISDELSIGTQSPKIKTEFTDELIISPNPTKDMINISLSTVFENISVEIFNENATIVVNQEYFNVKNIDMSVKGLNNGTYYIRVICNGNVIGENKIIIMK